VQRAVQLPKQSPRADLSRVENRLRTIDRIDKIALVEKHDRRRRGLAEGSGLPSIFVGVAFIATPSTPVAKSVERHGGGQVKRLDEHDSSGCLRRNDLLNGPGRVHEVTPASAVKPPMRFRKLRRLRVRPSEAFAGKLTLQQIPWNFPGLRNFVRLSQYSGRVRPPAARGSPDRSRGGKRRAFHRGTHADTSVSAGCCSDIAPTTARPAAKLVRRRRIHFEPPNKTSSRGRINLRGIAMALQTPT